jgi:hypothetical protein
MGTAPMDRTQRRILASMFLVGGLLTALTFSRYVDEGRFVSKFESVDRAGSLAVGTTEIAARF